MNTKNIIKCTLMLLAAGISASCNDFLEVKPDNEQVTSEYWKTKEDVDAVLSSGYYYMRECVPTFIKWGELRGGTIYSSNSTDAKLQDFNMTPDHSLCKWDNVYKVIGLANSVLENAPAVKSQDKTYDNAVYSSDLAAAYFMRAWCYFTLMKNYGEVPLVTAAYVDDSKEFDVAKSAEKDIIARIKQDVYDALAMGNVRTSYETEWETKGCVTRWALYALMADVCLWNGDYDECIKYCDLLLNPTETFHPAFLKNASDWYTIFYPGNSNESIFELNWDHELDANNEENNFYGMFTLAANSRLMLTARAAEEMRAETQELRENGYTTDERMGRMLLATYIPAGNDVTLWETASQYYIWKYYGNDIATLAGGARIYQDANFIIYRMAEIILMKAEACVMKGKGQWTEAVRLINLIRNRAGLDGFNGIDAETEDAVGAIAQFSEWQLLQAILHEREMEFVAEGKRWYDLMRMARLNSGMYREQIVNLIVGGNQTTKSGWVKSVLEDYNAWYMPLPQADVEANSLLVQNPYYE